MTRFFLAAALASMLGSPAFADNGGSLVGRWVGDYKTDEGIDREAELLVAGNGATWTGRPKGSAGKNNPCFNRAFPVLIETSESGVLSLWIRASQALPVCKDMRLQLTRMSPTRLEGRFKSGAPVWLEKQ